MHTALTAFGLAVDVAVSLTKAQCTGQVSLLDAHIGGTLECDEAVFSNPDGPALTVEPLQQVRPVELERGAPPPR